MEKFNRNYRLVIEKRDKSELTIQLPFTIEFEAHRNSFSSANIASVRIYNLNPDNRNQIQRNQYDYLDLRKISLFAGYGDHLALVFSGNINQAWSVREGNNFITQIESYDGGLAYNNAITSTSFNGPPSNTTQQSIIESLAKSLNSTETGDIKVGAIGNYDGQISRGNSFSGNTLQILSEMIGGSGGGIFIDNGVLHILRDNEAIQGVPPVISSKTGLLGTPIVEETYINIDMLFEPSLKVGQLIELDSSTADDEVRLTSINVFSKFNGVHKVISIKHHGMISSAVCGSVITSVGLLPGNFEQVPVQS